MSVTTNGVTVDYTYDIYGRIEQQVTKRGDTTILTETYTYYDFENNTTSSQTYEYIYSGNLLAQMIITDHTAEPDLSQTVEFSYDSSGMPLTMTYDGQTYYYVVNSQGDVVGLVDETGCLKLNYTYEAFGAEYISTSSDAAELAAINPLTYRGYVQDVETGMYYLQTRYYDPTLGRFFNRDTTGVLEMSAGAPSWDKNLYAYCDNNPVCREDTNGQGWHILIAAAVSGTIALGTSLYSEIRDDGRLKGYELLNVLVSTTCASGEGALSAMVPPVAMVWISAGSAALESAANDLIDHAFSGSNEKVDWGVIGARAMVSADLSLCTSAIGSLGDEFLDVATDSMTKTIKSTIKANDPELEPLERALYKRQAEKSAKFLGPLCVTGSILKHVGSSIVSQIKTVIYR